MDTIVADSSRIKCVLLDTFIKGDTRYLTQMFPMFDYEVCRAALMPEFIHLATVLIILLTPGVGILFSLWVSLELKTDVSQSIFVAFHKYVKAWYGYPSEDFDEQSGIVEVKVLADEYSDFIADVEERMVVHHRYWKDVRGLKPYMGTYDFMEEIDEEYNSSWSHSSFEEQMSATSANTRSQARNRLARPEFCIDKAFLSRESLSDRRDSALSISDCDLSRHRRSPRPMRRWLDKLIEDRRRDAIVLIY